MDSKKQHIPWPSSSSSSREQGKLGVGATVTAAHGVKKELTTAQLLSKRLGKKVRQSRESMTGVVVSSAPEKSWVVFWFEIEKTSRSTGRLTVLSNPSKTSLEQVKSLSLQDKPIDFSSDSKLRDYMDRRQNLSDLAASGGKIPAKPLVTPTKPSASSSSC